jgi:multidrug efflux system membrane fusion protein
MNPAQETPTQLPPAGPVRTRRSGRWILVSVIGLATAVGLVTWYTTSLGKPAGAATGARGGRANDPSRPIPVAVQPVVSQSFERTLTALGTVTARATVTVKVLVDGQLTTVAFTEGQLVRAGDLLAQVDPRPFEAVLANAKAALERDDAQLQNSLLDLERYRNLSAEDSIPKQQLDTQQALVRQLHGTVNADRAQIETAQLNLTYSHVTAPVSGRVGLRQVDVGNVVHASDTTGLVVITEVQPIDVVFPIPQDALPDVLRRMHAGARLAVDAVDRDGHTVLAGGTLSSTDNMIDTTTGTVKLKAAFPNRDLTLFPNQFVNARLHLETIPNTLTIPAAAVQRGAPGYYVYLVQKDGTVTMRTPKLGLTEGDQVQVLDGLALNDRVVVDGTDKLREGARVEVIDANARKAGPPRGGNGAPGRRHGADGPAGAAAPGAKGGDVAGAAPRQP